jgi:hypothetical protein
MTREDLQRFERELEPLEPLQAAGSFARQDARRFNAELGDLRGALLEPLRSLAARGTVPPDLASCLARTVAELVFWRRVLVQVHRGAFPPAPASSAFLLSYLRS